MLDRCCASLQEGVEGQQLVFESISIATAAIDRQCDFWVRHSLIDGMQTF